MRNSTAKYILVFLLDIFVAILILLLFTYIFVGKERLMSLGTTPTLPDNSSLQLKEETVPQPTDIPNISENEDKTAWQIKFADKFSDETVCTDNSYSSKNLSITITSDLFDNGSACFNYYLADIYISSLDCFRTFTIGHDYDSSSAFNILDINNYTNALLSVNGDACVWQSSSLIIRNGERLKNSISDYTGKELILTNSGEMLYSSAFSDIDTLVENTYQMWNFGPALLDENGHSYHPTRADSYIAKCHPRTAVGYFEPGHYCFIVVDGRQSGSDGCYLEDLGDLFESLGCSLAYNMDGGSSSMMAFNGSIVSNPSADLISGGVRALSDTIYIWEPVEK